MTAGQLENPVTRERFTIRDRGPGALVLEVRVPPATGHLGGLYFYIAAEVENSLFCRRQGRARGTA
jgi:hypothetical protein